MFDNLSQAQRYVSQAQKYFQKDAIKLIQKADGRYKASISKPEIGGSSIYAEMDSRPLENTPDKELKKIKGTKTSMREMLDKSKGVHQLIGLLRNREEYNAVLDLIEESGTGLFERLADVSVQFDEVNQQRNKVQYN